MARTKLNLDWDSLFPGDTVTIGNTPVVIKPLGLISLATIAKQLKGFGALLEQEGVSWDNYMLPENMLKLAIVLLDQFPSVIAEATNIDEEDISRLPIDVIVQLLDKVIEVNLKSKDDLEKNFKSLTERFLTVMPQK